MDPEIFLAFVAVMSMIGTGAWLTNKSLRVREEEAHAGRADAPTRAVELLAGENERLTVQIGRLEERIATLERIVTDPAERTAAAIESLR